MENENNDDKSECISYFCTSYRKRVNYLVKFNYSELLKRNTHPSEIYMIICIRALLSFILLNCDRRISSRQSNKLIEIIHTCKQLLSRNAEMLSVWMTSIRNKQIISHASSVTISHLEITTEIHPVFRTIRHVVTV